MSATIEIRSNDQTARAAAKPRNGARSRRARARRGLHVPRHFTRAGEDPFDAVEWELRTATIANERGEVIFEQSDVEIPKSWSQLATNVVVSKYFRGR